MERVYDFKKDNNKKKSSVPIKEKSQQKMKNYCKKKTLFKNITAIWNLKKNIFESCTVVENLTNVKSVCFSSK